MERDLLEIPGVGKAMKKDLLLLGYRCVEDLKGCDPQEMYVRLCEITHSKQDRCVLYVFRLVKYYAENREYDPEKLKWWNWKD